MKNIYDQEFTAEEIRIVIEAQEAQIANPARSAVCSENGFVKDRIRDAGYPGLADRYWLFTTSSGAVNSEQIVKNRDILRSLGGSMPAWGYTGT